MEKYINFFNNYAKHYMEVAKNEYQRIHINRKIEHSKRVNRFALEIANKLNLSKDEIYIINISSLLHDIGRLKQFYEYNTYIDKISVNHALLGCKILENEHILDNLDEEKHKLIFEIIKMHNYKEIPQNISNNLYSYTSIIRDADKIDWLYGMVNIIPNLSEKDQAVFYSNKSNKNYISKKLVDSILKQETIIKDSLTTINELRVANLAWITSDIKCEPSYDIIKRENLIDKAYELIQDSEEKRIIFNFINDFIKLKKYEIY